jgi:hypothetical protein
MHKTLQDAEREAVQLVSTWTWRSMGISLLPGGSIGLTAVGWAMIDRVAKIFEVDSCEKESIAGAIAIGLAALGSLEAFSFLPVIGWCGRAVAGGIIMKVIGRAVLAHYRGLSKLPDVAPQTPAIGE